MKHQSPLAAAALAIPQQNAGTEDSACLLVPSPKQNGRSFFGRAGWYPYYAGYSATFVRSVLGHSKLKTGALVLDPWNGAGTTTQVANDLGYGAVGFDLNPAMVLVARARLLDERQVPELRHALTAVIQAAKSYRTRTYIQNDPLELWLSPDTARKVRHTERAIRQVFEASGDIVVSDVNNLSVVSSFAYLALFRVLSHSLSGFKASNPAWLKTAKSSHDLVTLSGNKLLDGFGRYFLALLDAYDYDHIIARQPGESRGNTARIEVADSVQVPLATHSADIVIASPPYCTRIDYAVATSVELAVLGFDPRGSLKELRARMIGTSTIQEIYPDTNQLWGATCNELLEMINKHSSKSSRSYYLKTHVQYFDSVYKSLVEIGRCLRLGGHCVLVLQDSYYKDVHNDLPQIIAEMARSLGWKLHCRSDFRVSRTMAGRNGRSRQYRPTNVATESVLWFLTPERATGLSDGQIQAEA